MKRIIDKIFSYQTNLNTVKNKFLEIKKNTKVKILFDLLNQYNKKSQIRYVGGCVRKILNNEEVDDIDLATNIIPEELIHILKKK
tara:strand:+ start:40 stop:294 length:255 start_codon:yes stop_codon:yes gene_type:complete